MFNSTTFRLIGKTLLVLLGPACLPATPLEAVPMEMYVSETASFAIYKPWGWPVTEANENGQQSLQVTHPSGEARIELQYGTAAPHSGVFAVLRQTLDRDQRRHREFIFDNAQISRDGNRLVFDATFLGPDAGRRRARYWISVADGRQLIARWDANTGAFATYREAMLSTISNLRPLRGADVNVPPAPLPLRQYTLGDGSARFAIPQGWACQEHGRGSFWCQNPSSDAGFGVVTTAVLSPALGVSVPGTPMAPYMPPRQALPYLARAGGVAHSFQFEMAEDRPDLAGLLARVYTAGPVLAGEMLYTCTGANGARSRGYTMGISFGSRLQTNWNFTHLTVVAREGEFATMAPTFVEMLRSYQIDDGWARQYVAAGMQRLATMTRQTSQMVARNHAEITQMINDMYEGRQRSRDYIDYQFTTYMRGESDWISAMEGGKVYHSDTWGLRDTTTGDEWNGKPWDYVHFEGSNPRYREDMEPVTNRDAWERAFGR